jgi:hypothetical protein
MNICGCMTGLGTGVTRTSYIMQEKLMSQYEAILFMYADHENSYVTGLRM